MADELDVSELNVQSADYSSRQGALSLPQINICGHEPWTMIKCEHIATPYMCTHIYTYMCNVKDLFQCLLQQIALFYVSISQVSLASNPFADNCLLHILTC